ncbi:hypothetical protein [Glycomyces arizonensis]|uniref:hypothetical protein n=1 Tax=Glycomyces arizonensis TaxID=256035 RepID=UPI000403412D|nr:hypothetical protein [Glycomyces arizonensis]
MTQPSQAPGAPTDAGPTGQAPEASPQQGTTTDPATDPGQAPDGPQDVSSLPQWAQDLITKGRTKEADYRTKYQTAQKDAQAAASQRDAVLKAYGLNADGSEAVDPDKLSAQVDQMRAREWETVVENKLLRAAPRLGVDADGLLDSVAFLDSLAELDTDHVGADFGQKLEAHVTEFVTANPKFKAQPGAGAHRSGGDFGGGPNLPPASLDAQIAEAQKKGDAREVIRLQNQKFANQGGQ